MPRTLHAISALLFAAFAAFAGQAIFQLVTGAWPEMKDTAGSAVGAIGGGSAKVAPPGAGPKPSPAAAVNRGGSNGK